MLSTHIDKINRVYLNWIALKLLLFKAIALQLIKKVIVKVFKFNGIR